MALCAALLLGGGVEGGAFSLIGPVNPGTPAVAINNANYYSFPPPGTVFPPGVNTPPNGTQQQGYLNHFDPMGWPVPIKQFYRWNFPELTYAFDSTFVHHFGHNGMQAIHSAFEVLNDFFQPQDGSYSGVSALNLIEEYDKHYATWKFNPSANVNNIVDMETMTLGLLVNHLGLGNPHRHCFTIRDILSYNPGASTGNFQIAIRNYDPFTYHPSRVINGVTYSYFIYSGVIGTPTVVDAIEYAISSDYEYSAVAGIRDVINFPNALPWPMIAPTVFRTPGVYFAPDDPLNKPAPQNVTRQVRSQPRHTLTFDDAGGLRYLYRTNNIVWETYDATVQRIEVPNMNPQKSGIPNANWPFNNFALRTFAGGAANAITPIHPAGVLRPQPVAAAFPAAAARSGLRGGIDKIQFTYQPYDSLLGTLYRSKTTVWTDVFVTNTLPSDVPQADPPYFAQKVGRTRAIPDIVFIADDLSLGAAGALPVIQIPGPGIDWDGSQIANNSQQGVTSQMLGPGVIEPPGATPIRYFFTTRAPFNSVIWTGEPGLEGNFITQFQWGWITNTGPNDYIKFPETDKTQVESIVGPSGTPPKVTRITVYDALGLNFQPVPFDIDRSRDTITIYGQRLDSVTSIKILDHDTIVDGNYVTLETIEARPYILSDQQIIIPPGTLGHKSVSPSTGTTGYRKIVLVNSKGESEAAFLYVVRDGRPIINSTQFDGLPLNTSKSLILQGSGFKLSGGDVNQLWFFDDSNSSNYNLEPGSAPGAFPDPIAILDINSSNTSFASTTGVPVNYSDIVVTDTMIYLPPNILSDGNYTYTTSGFGSMGLGTVMGRSDGNNTSIAVDAFTRQVRLVFNPDDNGLPNANVNISPPRALSQAYTHLGVGGDRNSTVSGYPLVTPNIVEVFTSAAIPGVPATPDDANRTWIRGNDADVLTIRGTGLDLALSVEFVDGNGNPILSTDPATGLPPQPISLRDAAEPSSLTAGITITDYPPLGRDGYQIQIAPVAFGMNANPLFDSQAGTNINQLRRVVIRTPFGTAMAPSTAYMMIQQ